LKTKISRIFQKILKGGKIGANTFCIFGQLLIAFRILLNIGSQIFKKKSSALLEEF